MNSSSNITYYGCDAANAKLSLGVNTEFQGRFYHCFTLLFISLIIACLIKVDEYISRIHPQKNEKIFLIVTICLFISYSIFMMTENFLNLYLCINARYFFLLSQIPLFLYATSIYFYCIFQLHFFIRVYASNDESIKALKTHRQTIIILVVIHFIVFLFHVVYLLIPIEIIGNSPILFRSINLLIRFIILIIQLIMIIRFRSKLLETLKEKREIKHKNQPDEKSIANFKQRVSAICVFFSLKFAYFLLNTIFEFVYEGKSILCWLREKNFNEGGFAAQIVDIVITHLIIEILLILILLWNFAPSDEMTEKEPEKEDKKE